MKDSDGKFIFLLDGYDELKVPKNMYAINKMSEWQGKVKMIMTSRHEYLAAYGSNYLKYFAPRNADSSGFRDYTITTVSKEQRTIYISKKIAENQKKAS